VKDDLEALVADARGGSRDSLERLVVEIQRPIYNLARRMLWHPEDARDASQEILIRVVTHLSAFRGDSRFLTWMYRIAANYLISVRQSRVESQGLTFNEFAADLTDGLSDLPAGSDEWPADKAVLLEEVKIGCMHALLTCLDRPHRLAYILGEILELEGPEAARILGISATAFRKRLSRAREAIVGFTRAHCGLVNAEKPCRCVRRLPRAQATGRIDTTALLFGRADSAQAFPGILERVRRLENVQRTAALYRATPDADPGPELLARIQAAIEP
jgi:RNA polymerase sigma factor (sigma-70 family)